MNEAARSPKYPETRALVRIALGDGMTQTEIARRCRTQQSVVSRWANGRGLATEQQLAPLVELFGYRLNRSSAGVYRVVGPRDCAWEASPEAEKLRRLCGLALGSADAVEFESLDDRQRQVWVRTSQLQAVLGPAIGEHADASLKKLEETLRADFDHASDRLVRVEGPVLFRHTFEIPTAEPKRNAYGKAVPTLRMQPRHRWLVHRAGRQHFRLVRLRTAELVGSRRVAWFSRVAAALKVNQNPFHMDDSARGGSNLSSASRNEAVLPTADVYSRDEAGRWVATIDGPHDLAGLLARCDALLAEVGGPQDVEVVPFLLRKALLDHAYDLPDVERLGPVVD